MQLIDKKHIDLSSEPMILVCAAGLSGSTADDVAKEVAIYQAHKALPIVIADEREERGARDARLRLRRVHKYNAWLPRTGVGRPPGPAEDPISACNRPLPAPTVRHPGRFVAGSEHDHVRRHEHAG